MTFDYTHIWSNASLSDPYWVTAAFLWAMLIAHEVLAAIRATGWERRRCAAYALLSVLAATVGTHLIANIFQSLIAASSSSYSGGPLWLAVPIAAPLIAFRLRWPSVDRWLVVARTMSVLLCLHAIWAVMWFPGDLQFTMSPDRGVSMRDTLRLAPVSALSGVLAMVALGRFLGDRGRARGWRAWLTVRLQVAVLYLAFLIETHVFMIATFPFLVDDPFPWLRFFIGLVIVLGVMALWRVRRQRMLSGALTAALPF